MTSLKNRFNLGVTVDKSKATRHYNHKTGKTEALNPILKFVEEHNPIDILDKIDIRIIEKYLRNKKLDSLEK